MKYIPNTPEGTRDLLFGECMERRIVQSQLTRVFRQRGYTEIMTPEMEYYDVFTLAGNNIPQENLTKVIDRSGKIVSNARYDEVSNENDRWFGCHGTTEYLLDSNGNEREQANYCYVPSTWAENIVEQAEKDGLRLSYHTPYRLNIHRDEFCKLAWQTIQTVNPNINLPELAQPFSDCDEDIVRQIAALGIVTGYEDGTFQPTRELSRQEAAVILQRLYTVLYGKIEASPTLYADNGSIGVWAKDSVYAMRQTGIMQGVGANRFDPKNGYTCEQSIITMLRMTQKA